MSSKTKILVLKSREIILTLVFTILAIVVIIALFLAFTGKSKKSKLPVNSGIYNPGVYTASIVLASNPVDIEVTVDHSNIKSVNLVNTSESVAAMFPLITTSMDSIATQVIHNNSTENISYSGDSKYTSIVLINAISSALEKASSN